MELRELGKSGIKVAPLALGTNVFRWTIDDTMAFRVLDAFTAAGLNLIDTADVYSRWVPGNIGGESETVIGNWLKQKGNRSKVIIATKVGHSMGMGEGMKGLSKKYIMEAVEASLKRLQTDYIDLYQSHEDDLNTPIQETLGAYDTLIKQGKVRAIGASNFTAKRLAESLHISEILKLPIYQTLQPLYNLYDRADFEKDLQQLCVDKHVSVICFYGLAKGFLSGKYRTKEDVNSGAHGSRVVSNYMNERGMRILKALDEVAAAHNAKQASVALAWLMARPSIVAPIASATNLTQVEELVNSVHLKLSQADMEKLTSASSY